jgi:propanol-preferring alcohol dehydrogenase
MKCMVIEKFNAPLAFRERALPIPAAGEVVLKVGACGLCRTDLKVWRGTHPRIKNVTLPLVPGHEVAGEIVDLGQSVSKDLLAKHAVVYLYCSCGKCEFCRSGREMLCNRLRGQVGFSLDGGFAEYIKVPADSVFPIPPEIPFPQIAIVTDAIAAPYRALAVRARVEPGEIVVVIGAGGLGVHAIQIAKVLGARVIALDVNEKAVALAKQVGADRSFHAVNDDVRGEIQAISPDGVHVVVDFVAIAQTQQLGLSVLKTGGRFVTVAYNSDNILQVTSPLLVSKELQVMGSRSCSRKDLQEAIELVSASKVKPVVANCYPLADANLALSDLEQGDVVGRSVLIP